MISISCNVMIVKYINNKTFCPDDENSRTMNFSNVKKVKPYYELVSFV